MRNHIRPEWRLLGSQSVQDVIERIDKSYQRFFSWCKTRTGRRVSPPKFKKRVNYKSFTLKQSGWELLGEDRVQLGKCSYRFHNSRPIDGQIKTVTIVRDAVGDYWIVFSVVNGAGVAKQSATGKTAGLDFGLKTFATFSDRTTISAPQPLLKQIKQLRNSCRNLSKKKKGSNGRKRAKLALARLYRRVADIRRDWQFQTAATLTRHYDIICIEDLGLQGMKALWGRKVSDLAWSDFVKTLKWQAMKYGCTIVEVDRYFPSSKLCSECGYIHKDLELKDREWTCPECGTHHDRDANAAINIHREGLRILADSGNNEAGHRLREKAA
jgi:putative transposase